MRSKIDFDVDFFDHPDYYKQEEVERILSYTIKDEDFDERYDNDKSGILRDIIKNYPILKRESTYNLFIKYNLLKKLRNEGQDLDKQIKELKNDIICHNIRLIPGSLRTFRDREDYFSQAYVTLDRCVDRFNPNLGFTFNTYATNSIFRNCARSKQEDYSMSSMTYSISNSEEMLIDFKNKDLSTIDSNDLVCYVEGIINTLNTKERDVMVRFFGLFGTERETLTAIASRHKVSKERIRQIKERVLRRFYIKLGIMPILADCI